jgi:hypothetical protein
MTIKIMFDLRKCLLNGVEIRRVRREVNKMDTLKDNIVISK